MVNLLNNSNDQEISVKSTNIDRHRVTFHSLFYRILTPASTNFLDCGSVVINSPTVRTFTIDNISSKRLLLELTSSMSDDIKIYSKGAAFPHIVTPSSSSASTIQRREKILESFSEKKKKLTKAITAAMSNAGSATPTSRPFVKTRTGSNADATNEVWNSEYLDLANEGKKSPKRRNISLTHASNKSSFKGVPVTSQSTAEPSPLVSSISSLVAADENQSPSEISDEPYNRSLNNSALHTLRLAVTNNSLALVEILEAGSLSIDSLISLLEVMTGVPPPILADISSEERYIRAQILLRRELAALISSNNLIPVSVVEIPAESELTVVIVYTPKGSNKPFVQVYNN